MTNAEKLYAMGCGNEIVNSTIERGAISAAVNNTKMWFKYYKGALKSGLYDTEQVIDIMTRHYNELMKVEWLVKKYHALWSEEFYSIQLPLEKFLSELKKK